MSGEWYLLFIDDTGLNAFTAHSRNYVLGKCKIVTLEEFLNESTKLNINEEEMLGVFI